MAGSDITNGPGGVSFPREAWTIDILSSTVTHCGPLA
jgi:hypothetical protein